MVSKEIIINYLKEYYQKTNEIPKARDKTHPFSSGSVTNYFGSWANALTESGIPLRMNPPQLVLCKKCNKEFKKLYKEIIKSNNHFCSNSCSASYNNTHRIITDEHKKHISDSLKKFNESHKSMNNLLNSDISKIKVKKVKLCVICNIDITELKRKTCSLECLKKLQTIQGRINGTISASKNIKRSKGEILFANLCIQYFGKDDILCNEIIFKDNQNNFWDSDIYIKSLKMAILYDGIWHFQQVRKEHNLKQVQSRDIIKRKIILNNGCFYYTIKDLGKFDIEFVTNQFNLFIHTLSFNKVLYQMNTITHKLTFNHSLIQIKSKK